MLAYSISKYYAVTRQRRRTRRCFPPCSRIRHSKKGKRLRRTFLMANTPPYGQPQNGQPQYNQPPQPQDEPLPCVQVQVHVHVGFVVDVPPTAPEDCLQHGLQHRCWTKSGNVRPLKPLQKQAIAHTSKKISGNIGSRSILCPACAFGVRLCRFSPRWAAQARRRSPAAGSAASAAVS